LVTEGSFMGKEARVRKKFTDGAGSASPLHAARAKSRTSLHDLPIRRPSPFRGLVVSGFHADKIALTGSLT